MTGRRAIFGALRVAGGAAGGCGKGGIISSSDKTILATREIVKAYATVRAVDGLSFDIREGEIFALLGPNGAGKTSTVRMLIGLTRPDSGTIDYQSRDGTCPQVAGSELGYLPEERGLYQDQPVLKVLVYLGRLQGMTRNNARERAMHWLERLDLADRAKEKLGALSKGNQQKIQLISAVLHRPRFAVLDEPFSGLDPVNQEKLIELIRELRREGVTILLSAHQMALVERLADRILLMNRGKTVMNGTLDELRRQSGLNTSLVVTFRDGVPAELDLPSETGHVETQTVDRISISLTRDADLNQLLRQLERLGAISAMKTETPTLHDLYLHAVDRPVNEEAPA